MEFRCWLISNVIIYIKSIAYIFVTWRLEALHQGDHEYFQCQGSKKREIKGAVLFVMNIYGNLNLDLLHMVSMRCL